MGRASDSPLTDVTLLFFEEEYIIMNVQYARQKPQPAPQPKQGQQQSGPPAKEYKGRGGRHPVGGSTSIPADTVKVRGRRNGPNSGKNSGRVETLVSPDASRKYHEENLARYYERKARDKEKQAKAKEAPTYDQVLDALFGKRRNFAVNPETVAEAKAEEAKKEAPTFKAVDARFEAEKAKYEALLKVQFIQPGQTVGTRYTPGRDIKVADHHNSGLWTILILPLHVVVDLLIFLLHLVCRACLSKVYYIYDYEQNINVANILSQVINKTWGAAYISHWSGKLADELENISAEIETAADRGVIEWTKAGKAASVLCQAAKELRKPKPNLIGILRIILQVIIFIAKTKRLIGMGVDLIMAYLAIRWLLLESWRARMGRK